jgi:Tat protein secretion system quality control protein TatD with DNase activity
MAMVLIDSHCHLHDSEFYSENREDAYRESRAAGVEMLCVGTDARPLRL